MYCSDFACSTSLKNLNHFGDSPEGVGKGLPASPPLLLRFRVPAVGRGLTLLGSSFRGFSGPLVV